MNRNVQQINAVLNSPQMNEIYMTLKRVGSEVDTSPIVNKYLDSFLRLIFPVSGAIVQEGTVVSVVALYDVQASRTMYVHPMHAGPNSNPLLKHFDGPMANPKPQQGIDGARAIHRLLNHKHALWDRFCRERTTIGKARASQRWRTSYYWALRRLYFCARCVHCRWGNSFFCAAGWDPSSTDDQFADVSELVTSVPDEYAGVVNTVVQSMPWKTDVSYIKRGGWEVNKSPRLIQQQGDDCLQLIFPTNARIVQGGTIVALAATYHRPTSSVRYTQSLVVGPETEITFRHPESLALPSLRLSSRGERAILEYSAWRENAWNQYWLNELEQGLKFASTRWLNHFWEALATLFDTNPRQANPLFYEEEEVTWHGAKCAQKRDVYSHAAIQTY